MKFDSLNGQRTSSIIKFYQILFIGQDPGDLEGWEEISSDDRQPILLLISQHQESPKKGAATPKQGM